jgi:hypothetical protein
MMHRTGTAACGGPGGWQLSATSCCTGRSRACATEGSSLDELVHPLRLSTPTTCPPAREAPTRTVVRVLRQRRRNQRSVRDDEFGPAATICAISCSFARGGAGRAIPRRLPALCVRREACIAGNRGSSGVPVRSRRDGVYMLNVGKRTNSVPDRFERQRRPTLALPGGFCDRLDSRLLGDDGLKLYRSVSVTRL